jgi:hypothetical protein
MVSAKIKAKFTPKAKRKYNKLEKNKKKTDFRGGYKKLQKGWTKSTL